MQMGVLDWIVDTMSLTADESELYSCIVMINNLALPHAATNSAAAGSTAAGRLQHLMGHPDSSVQDAAAKALMTCTMVGDAFGQVAGRLAPALVDGII